MSPACCPTRQAMKPEWRSPGWTGMTECVGPIVEEMLDYPGLGYNPKSAFYGLP